MNNYNCARLLAATALMALATLAHAQYMWIDEKGVKQFSDRAPPPSVPLKNILKQPGRVSTPVLVSTEPPAPALAQSPELVKPAAATAKAAPTTADRNADYNKRLKEKAELEQKEKGERDAKAAQAEHCERVRTAKRSFDSGARIGVAGKNGEPTFLTDEQRAAESQKLDKPLAACK